MYKQYDNIPGCGGGDVDRKSIGSVLVTGARLIDPAPGDVIFKSSSLIGSTGPPPNCNETQCQFLS